MNKFTYIIQNSLMYKGNKVIYFIQQTNNNIKIGYTQNVFDRLTDIQVGNSEKLKILFTIPGDKSIEKLIHNVSGLNNITGEWFEYNSTLQNLIFELFALNNLKQHKEYINKNKEKLSLEYLDKKENKYSKLLQKVKEENHKRDKRMLQSLYQINLSKINSEEIVQRITETIKYLESSFSKSEISQNKRHYNVNFKNIDILNKISESLINENE